MHHRIGVAALAAAMTFCGHAVAAPAPAGDVAISTAGPAAAVAPTRASMRPAAGPRAGAAGTARGDGTGTLHRALAQIRPLPRPAAVPDAGITGEWLRDQPMAVGGPEWRCLSEALYFEARGQTVPGQIAVAEVIMNRVGSLRFPDSVCAVVNQGTGAKWRCQFTYTCDGRPEVIGDRAAWARAGKLARVVLDGDAPDLTDGALYYHAQSVDPRWNDEMIETVSIGAHRFFTPPERPLG